MPTRWWPPSTRSPATRPGHLSTDRGDHGQHRPAASRRGISPAQLRLRPDRLPELHPQSRASRSWSDSTLYVERLCQLHQLPASASPGPRSTSPMTSLFDPPGANNEISGTGYQIAPHGGRPDDRAAAAARRQPHRDLQRPGQQRGVRDHHRHRSQRRRPSVNRNGNLQLAQFYYGAVQPSSAAAQVAGALFYAGAENIGGQASDPNLVSDGNLQWSALGLGLADYLPGQSTHGGIFTIASGTAVDQQGSGTALPVLVPRPGRRRHQFRPWSTASAGPSGCSRPATATPPPTRSGPSRQ